MHLIAKTLVFDIYWIQSLSCPPPFSCLEYLVSDIPPLLKQVVKEISKDDYFAKNNEFATWLKEEKGKYFSDLSSESAHDLFLKFVKQWNKGKLPSQYYEGITSGPRSAHNWNIKAWGVSASLACSAMHVLVRYDLQREAFCVFLAGFSHSCIVPGYQATAPFDSMLMKLQLWGSRNNWSKNDMKLFQTER